MQRIRLHASRVRDFRKTCNPPLFAFLPRLPRSTKARIVVQKRSAGEGMRRCRKRPTHSEAKQIMNVDDNDSRQPAEGQSNQAPAEPAPGDPSHTPVSPASSTIAPQPVALLETFDWTSVRSFVFTVINGLAGADDIVEVTRQKVGRITAAEWRGISNRHEHIYRMAHDQAKD